MVRAAVSATAETGEFSLASRVAALRTLLAPGRDAIVAAQADNGNRIPLPDSFPLGDHHSLPIPRERETMLEIIDPADRMAAVAAWERARAYGIGVAGVRLLSEARVRRTLGVIDARDLYGVWLAILARDGGPMPVDASHPLAGPISVPTRPRQATMHKTMAAIITDIDERTTAMLGWTPDEMIGRRSTEFIHPEDQERAVSCWMALMSSYGSQRVRFRHRCADGGWLWLELEQIHNGLDDPDEVEVTTHICDISEEMAAHEAVRKREQLFSRLAESLPTGVLHCNLDGTVLYVNPRLCTILHIDSPVTTSNLFGNVALSGREGAESALRAALHAGADSELEIEVRAGDARESRRCELTIAAVDDDDDHPGALVCVHDVTDSARMREELRQRATQDPLTDCLNRAAVISALEQKLTCDDPAEIVALFIDVDSFKLINDSFGHAAGDQVLIGLVRRLERIARDEDLVGRLGGDEFLLVCRAGGLPAGAEKLASRVRDALNQPFALSERTIDLQSSIGVAWPQGPTTAQQLIASADAAMYASKRQRRGEPVLFPDIGARASRG